MKFVMFSLSTVCFCLLLLKQNFQCATYTRHLSFNSARIHSESNVANLRPSSKLRRDSALVNASSVHVLYMPRL